MNTEEAVNKMSKKKIDWGPVKVLGILLALLSVLTGGIWLTTILQPSIWSWIIFGLTILILAIPLVLFLNYLSWVAEQ